MKRLYTRAEGGKGWDSVGWMLPAVVVASPLMLGRSNERALHRDGGMA